MNIEYFDTYQGMSRRGTDILIEEFRKKETAVFCAATGASPTGVYENLVREIEVNRRVSGNMRVVKLDEWGGISHNSEGTCERYLNDNLYAPLGISEAQRVSFFSEAPDPEKDCERIQKALDEVGRIDVCLLGLGKNGHIGLNEPAKELNAHCHVAHLAEQSKNHQMIADIDQKPKFGMTLGMGNILSAKKIILLVTGEGKRDALQKLLSGKISTDCPASFLQLHPNVDCLVDEGFYKIGDIGMRS
ncbi:MAG: galactosamine-6-phosphate isomerase [Cyclobacteriaceae bacterium]|nr:galactosamine-6-phosphate isomerase [Cyclobacteriaceae bacterium]